jgi:hypothetical protein
VAHTIAQHLKSATPVAVMAVRTKARSLHPIVLGIEIAEATEDDNEVEVETEEGVELHTKYLSTHFRSSGVKKVAYTFARPRIPKKRQ